MEGVEALAKSICDNRYTEEELNKFRGIIKNFNKLYYEQHKQTWCNTRWRGVSVYKAPTDLWIYQELIDEIKPDLIIETGSCSGGSALYMRDILNIVYPQGRIISIDIDDSKISDKAKVPGIEFYKGSSIADETVVYLKAVIAGLHCKRVMVILDSDHRKDHVVKELELYAPLVTPESILIVEDTNVNGNPVYPEYGPGPKEAIEEWWQGHDEFEINTMCEKFMLTFNRGGYLERKKLEGWKG
jgi:cephalosporin hydroxylase